MSFIKRVFDFIIHPTHLRTAILIIFITVIIIPITVLVSQQQQNTKQRASGFDSACAPPYEGYLGCFSFGNFPPNSVCTSSCTDLDGAEGQYCYSSTKVGNACVTESNQAGQCNDRGGCMSTDVPPTSIPTEIPTISLSPTTSLPACASLCGTSICATCTDGASICGTTDLSNCPSITPPPTTIPIISPTVTVPVTLIISPSPTQIIVPTTATQSLITPTLTVPTPTIVFCSLKSKGDANCDGAINTLDYEIWRIEFVNEIDGILTERKSDFNGMDGISIVDFSTWLVNSQDPSLPH